MAPEGAIDYAPVTVCLKAYPDTNLYGRGTPDPLANLLAKVPEVFVSQVSKIARPGETRLPESRFLTAKAVRNDKKEKVLGCGTAEAVPSRPLRTRTLAAASQE